ncbi:MAG TPA: penicillin-binding protein 2 [Solirubrobacterales bacterium]|nr:penicillin-binding protein 2 [Solirubrobacterales bacterium]
MYLRSSDRPGSSPRLALRTAVLGGFAVVLFAALFFRLWDLQVLSGDEYLAEAKNNRTREFKVIAPRGDILDRDGNVLVDNRTSLALQLSTQKLPADPAEEREVLKRLGGLTGMSLRKVRRTIRESEEVAAGAPVTLRKDVGYELVYYLEENQREFPGVAVQRVFVRAYPDGPRAAHVVGSVGEIDEEELKEARYRGLEPGDEIGRGGVEEAYDRYLRGDPGLTKIQVNALGQPTPGGQLVSRAPTPGDNLKLTIDPDVQAAGEAGLSSFGLPGAFVTMNVNNGQILGMGSNPTFDPTVLTKDMTQAQVNQLYRDPVLAPLTNRASESFYPVGSTFKVITALAALEGGDISLGEVVGDDGSIEVGSQEFQNAGGVALGPVDMVSALQKSSDVYFYLLGLEMWKTNQLQDWAEKLGIGRETGLDIPEGEPGLVPSKKWRDDLFAEGGTDRPWSAGDNIQLAIGQGDLQTNPLQLAIAYAAIANGGTIVTPHVGMEVEDAAGRVQKEFDVRPRRKVRIDPTYRAAVLEGLHQAAQAPEGTSYGVFGGFPIEVAGKTGTVERDGHGDQSWYAVVAPYRDPEIVTIVTVEEGGFGAESAAPVALDILEAFFHKQATEISAENGGSPG